MHPDISKEKLLELLPQGESTKLDYKVNINLSDKREVIEFAKDIAGFSDLGGWIIIGADDRGKLIGIPAENLRQWDESAVRNQLKKYLYEKFEIRLTVHQIPSDDKGGNLVNIVFVQVLEHPDGACIIRSDAHHPNDSNKQILKKGQIYTRHNTSTELISGRDLDRILNKRSLKHHSRDKAARAARDAAHHDLGDPELDTPSTNYLWFRLACAYSDIPTDINSRIFYDHTNLSFRRELAQTLENKIIRRDGHHYENHIQTSSDYLISSGIISHGIDPDAFIDVRVSSGGTISIAGIEKHSDWDYIDLFSWWIHGSIEIANIFAHTLELSGNFFICLRTIARDVIFQSHITEVTDTGLTMTTQSDNSQHAFRTTNRLMAKFSSENKLSQSPSEYSMKQRHQRGIPLSFRG